MQLGFIMLSEGQRQTVSGLQERLQQMRPDQVAHFEHLVRSWGIFRRTDGVDLAAKAVRRVLRDLP